MWWSLALAAALLMIGIRSGANGQLGWWMYTYVCHPFVFFRRSDGWTFVRTTELGLSPDTHDLYEPNIAEWLRQTPWKERLRDGSVAMIVLGSDSAWLAVPAAEGGLEIAKVPREQALEALDKRILGAVRARHG